MNNYNSYSHLFSGSWSIHNEEKPTWDYLQTFLRPGCTFFDIGCQKGIYSKGVIDLFGENCSVYGFDVLEHPEILELQKNHNNFKFINSAVGDGESTENCTIHYDTNTQLENQKTISLDKFCEENKINKIDFIKIDVDGCEKSILKGAKNILKNYFANLFIEIENEFDKCLEILNEYDYEYVCSKNDINCFFVKR
jgi:FkbM family methyltransferase